MPSVLLKHPQPPTVTIPHRTRLHAPQPEHSKEVTIHMAYAKFTPEMKKTYTILAPNMLPIHFHLLIRILEQFGYHVVLWNPPPAPWWRKV